MNAPRRPTLPQWKIDLVREAIKIIEGEKGRRVTAAMIAWRIPSQFSMADIEIAMELHADEIQRGGSERRRRLDGRALAFKRVRLPLYA